METIVAIKKDANDLNVIYLKTLKIEIL
ncbi:MAG: hypothetical protein ACI9QD_000777 [Thermoproteota archaeon]